MRNVILWAACVPALVVLGACGGGDGAASIPDAEATTETTAGATVTTASVAPTEAASATETAASADEGAAEFTVMSPAWERGGEIPARFTCDGADVSPPLAFGGFPEGTVTLAIEVLDHDAPGGTWVHWLAWNVAPGDLAEGTLPAGSAEGTNDFGDVGYGGPCPPSRHEYTFVVSALDTSLALAEGADLEALESAMAGHVLGQAMYTGMYGE